MVKYLMSQYPEEFSDVKALNKKYKTPGYRFIRRYGKIRYTKDRSRTFKCVTSKESKATMLEGLSSEQLKRMLVQLTKRWYTREGADLEDLNRDALITAINEEIALLDISDESSESSESSSEYEDYGNW